MDEVEVEVRRWGNSLGVIIPAETVRRERLAPADRVRLHVVKVRRPLPNSFGTLAKLAIDAAAEKVALRKEHAR